MTSYTAIEVLPMIPNTITPQLDLKLVDSSLQIAKEQYHNLLNNFREGYLAANTLFDKTSVESSNLRGLLLGRDDGVGATYDELWIARLQFDVPFSAVKYDLATAKIVKNVDKVTSAVELVDLLGVSIGVILANETSSYYPMFCCGEKGINKSVVRALHNIGKNETKFLLTDVVLDYQTRKTLIHLCVQRVIQRTDIKKRKQHKVNESDAQWAYQYMLGNGKFDITTQLTDLMKGGYLDFQIGATDKTKSVIDPKLTPMVRSYKFEHANGTTGETNPFTVCVIDNPISPAFKSRLVEALDTLCFTKGQGGKDKAYIRNVCSTVGLASLVIAKRHVYEAVHASPIEVEIIKIANHIATYQRNVIENTCCKEGFKVTFHCNLLHTVIAAIKDAVYSWHSDKSALLCSTDDEYCPVTKDLFLPQQREMQIMTLVLSNSVQQYSTGLEYSTEPDRGQKLKGRTVLLGSCCLHFQGAGSQAPGLKHKSSILPGYKPDGSIWRCISTMRFTLDPAESPESQAKVDERILLDLAQDVQNKVAVTDYNETGVLARCVGYGDPEVHREVDHVTDSPAFYPASSGSSSGNVKASPVVVPLTQHTSCDKRKRPHEEKEVEDFPYIDLSSPEYTDLYPTISHDEYSAMGLHQTGPTVRLTGSMASELGAAPMLEDLFCQGYLVQIETSKSGIIVPMLHEYPKSNGCGTQFPIPGMLYNLSNITADAGLTHNNHAHPILSRDANSQRIVVLSQPYKNNADTVIAFGKNAIEWFENEDDDCPLFKDGFTGEITIHGSGGSPTIAGAHPPSAKSSNVEDAYVLIPPNQDMSSPINFGLIDMCRNDEVVTIYYNEGMFNKGGGKTSNAQPDSDTTPPAKRASVETDCTMVRCLGTFSISDLHVTVQKLDDVIKKYKHLSLEEQMFYRYLTVKHIEATFIPFHTNQVLSQMKKQFTTPYREDFKVLTIPYGCKDRIEIDVDIGDGKLAASLHPEKMLTRRKVLKAFIANGGLLKYMSVRDQNKAADEESDGEEGKEMAEWDAIDESNAEKGAEKGGANLSDGEGMVIADGREPDVALIDRSKSSALASKGMTVVVGQTNESKSTPSATKGVANNGAGVATDNVREDHSDKEKLEAVVNNSLVKVMIVGIEDESEYKAGRGHGKGLIASLTDIFDAVLLNSYCGAIRYTKKEGLTEKGGVMFAKPLDDDTLPVLFRTHSLPMPNRALDVVTYGQRRAAFESGLFETFGTSRTSRIVIRNKHINRPPTKMQTKALTDTVFKSLMMRFTGRLNPFHLYSIHKKKPFLLPAIADADDFLHFMESTFPRGGSKNRTLGQWLTKQHEGSIPASTKNYAGFVNFVQAVCRHLPGTVITMLQHGGDSAKRLFAVTTLSSMLLSCCNGDTSGHLQFMAQLIVADVEELFDDPFGEVTSKGVVAGQGGKEGHVMLKNAGGAKLLEDAINSIIQYVTKTATSEQLAIAGYTFDEHGVVVNLVNGRPFNASDAEHFLCKAWMIGKLTLAHYNAKLPRPTKPHCHPVKLTKDKNPACAEIDIVMLGIAAAFQTQRKLLKTPHFCLSKRELMPQLG